MSSKQRVNGYNFMKTNGDLEKELRIYQLTDENCISQSSVHQAAY